MAASMKATQLNVTRAAGRPMAAAANAQQRAAAAPLRVARPARCVVVRAAADDDAELEARLAKLKAAKGATTDQEKRAARAARTGGAVKPVGGKAAGPAYDFSNETLHWEGGPARGDLVFNVALGATLVWLPLTFGAVGRAAFVKYRFTDRRLSVRDTLPWSGKQTDVAYQEVAEVRTVPRVFGAWGDMVVVLRNGDKVELLALEKYQELKKYILERRDALRPAGSSSSKGGAATRPSVMDLDADDEAVGLGAAAVGAGGKRTGKGFS